MICELRATFLSVAPLVRPPWCGHRRRLIRKVDVLAKLEISPANVTEREITLLSIRLHNLYCMSKEKFARGHLPEIVRNRELQILACNKTIFSMIVFAHIFRLRQWSAKFSLRSKYFQSDHDLEV